MGPPRSSRQNSRAAKWHVDNEYHVQALLWTILAPIFPDLKREEYAAQIGPIQPRVDFGIPSLRLLVEASFARDRSALKNMVNEIAQDASNYFATPGAYDSLLVFVWDSEGHTQDHDLVISGLRQFDRRRRCGDRGRAASSTPSSRAASRPRRSLIERCPRARRARRAPKVAET